MEMPKKMDFAWDQTSSRSSNTMELTPEAKRRAGELVDALHTVITEAVSLLMIAQEALSALLDAAKDEGYSH